MTSQIFRRSPLKITAVQLGLLLFFVFFTFIGGQTAQGIFDAVWRRNTLLVMTGLIGLWLGWRLLGRERLPRTPLDGPLLLLAVAAGLAAFFSQNPVYSHETLVFWGMYLAAFYAAADFGRRRWFTELAINAIVLVAGLVLAFGGLQLWWWLTDPAAGLPRLSVLGNPNTMASFLALVFPLGLARLGAAKNPLLKIALGGWALLLVAALLLTQSRGGLLALVVAGGFFGLSWFRAAGGAFARRWQWALAGAGLLLVGGLLALGLGLRGLNDGVDIRQQVMLGALRAWQAHPLFGVGPGALGQALLQQPLTLDQIWPDAHNLYLTFVAETGLLGAAGLGWLLLAAARRLWRDVARPVDVLPLACAAGLLGFAAHNLVDSQLKYPAIMLLVAVLAGFWLASPAESARSWGRPVAAAALVGLAVLFALGWRGGQNISSYNQAVSAAGQNDWAGAARQLADVRAFAPDNPFFQRQLAFALGMAASRDESARRQAIELYRAALATVDRLAIDHANLACLLHADGQPAAAIRELEQARQLELTNLTVRLALGEMLEQMGDDSGAAQEFAAVLAAQPDFAAAGFWQATPARAALAKQVTPPTAPLPADIPALEREFAAATAPSPNEGRYATEVARRRPLPASRLPCLRPVLPTARLIALTLAEGQALQQAGEVDRAAAVYRRLLAIEPAAVEVQSALDRL
ncbi:MAG: hypothetical protein FOGNACKC_02372 [Anaerolineae bacterium]|nr:hypothetical protein [Anaerolineae bacterium]